MHNFGRFSTTLDFDREYLWKGTRYPKSEKQLSRAIPPAIDKKVRRTLVHYLQRIPCEFGPTKMDFW